MLGDCIRGGAFASARLPLAEACVDGAILFSEAHAISMEYPDVVATLREILWLPGDHLSASQLFSQRMALLAHRGPVQDAAFALLRELQGTRPALSYLEAMGLLISAAAPADGAPPEPDPENVEHVARVFDQIVQQWPAAEPVYAVAEAVPSPLSYADPVLRSDDEAELGSALSRALARSTWEDVDESPQLPVINAGPASTAPVAAVKEQPAPLPVRSAAPGSLKNAVVLHEASEEELAKTEPVADEPAREVPRAEASWREPQFASLSQSNSPLHSASADDWAWNPRLLVIGTLLFGALLAFLLFRFAARANLPSPVAVNTAAGSSPVNREPVPAVVSAPAPVAGRSAAARAFGAPSHRTRTIDSAGPAVGAGAESASNAQPAARAAAGGSASPASSPGASGSLVPVPHAVSLGLPTPPSPNEGKLPGVTVGSAGVMAANVLASPAPAYPAEARAAHVQGEVIVEATVGKDGDVLETRVISGPVLLQEAAKRAVLRWRYRPYLADGKPAEILATARIEFRLR